ncbi:branched-chain amino acid ABC transporter permease [Acrocarpospora sp. B8E8]|uniref:branched-chain amino acid ABC transporter permease n=1 Tax=Acrocarpospora sp. B8E8 TaxID=3153572 RepID=UPI00325EDAEF
MSVSKLLPEGRVFAKDATARVVPPPPIYSTHPLRFLAIVTVIAILVPFLFGGDTYAIDLLNSALIHAMLVLGFYWCFTLGGRFTFGVFAVYAAGAYISVWAANQLGGFWAGLIVATLATAALGCLMQLLFARSSLIFFAIVTMAVGGLLLIVFREWTAFTGGYEGLSEIAVPSVFGFTLDSHDSIYYLVLGVLVLFLLATALFLRSPAARDLTMARDKGPVAAVAGLRPKHLQLVAFGVGSGMQGAAGSLYAHSTGYFSLEAFNIDVSLLVLLMLLLGGMNSMYGPVIGAVVLVYLPELLREVQDYADFVYGVAVLVIVVAFPSGIAGLRQTVERRLRHAGSQ